MCPPMVHCSLARASVLSRAMLRSADSSAHAPGSQVVVVVGAGAAGVFAAIAAARHGASVHCLESGTKPLRKVRISGGGRCNVMHDPDTWSSAEGRDLLAGRYPRGNRALIGAFTKLFSPVETAIWFEREGVELKREEDGRVFPRSDDSATIVDALLGAARAAGVRLMLGAKVCDVKRLEQEAGGGPGAPRFRLDVKNREGSRSSLNCSALVLATGSASHGLAKGLGHAVEPLCPSLFSLRVRDGFVTEALAGVAVPDVEVQLHPRPGSTKKKRSLAESRGPLLITHRGLSGPAILRLSSFAAMDLAAMGYEGTITLNLAPDIAGAQEAEEKLHGLHTGPHKQKLVSNINPFGLPKRLWAALVAADDAVGAMTWAQLTKTERRDLARSVCGTRLRFTGKDANKDEFVTCGGVRLKEVDFQRMESKVVEGLFFAGEVLDVDGITGGHNFQVRDALPPNVQAMGARQEGGCSCIHGIVTLCSAPAIPAGMLDNRADCRCGRRRARTELTGRNGRNLRVKKIADVRMD